MFLLPFLLTALLCCNQYIVKFYVCPGTIELFTGMQFENSTDLPAKVIFYDPIKSDKILITKDLAEGKIISRQYSVFKHHFTTQIIVQPGEVILIKDVNLIRDIKDGLLFDSKTYIKSIEPIGSNIPHIHLSRSVEILFIDFIIIGNTIKITDQTVILRNNLDDQIQIYSSGEIRQKKPFNLIFYNYMRISVR